MSDRFDSNSLFYQSLQSLLNKSEQIEGALSSGRLLYPGQALGLNINLALQLLIGVPWKITGEIQCADVRYLRYNLGGDDNPLFHRINSFSFSIFDARGVPGRTHLDFLSDSRNASYIIEFISTDLKNNGSGLGVHIHKRGIHGSKSIPGFPEPLMPSAYSTLLDLVVNIVGDPDHYWNSLP